MATSSKFKRLLDAYTFHSFRPLCKVRCVFGEAPRELAKRPNVGNLIKNSSGIRKLRWKRAGTGKRGGIRVIYYWITEDNQIFMLVAYPKSIKDNLTDRETAIFCDIVKEL